MGKVFDQRVEHMPWLQGASCTILVQLKVLAREVYQMLPHNFDNIQRDGDLDFLSPRRPKRPQATVVRMGFASMVKPAAGSQQANAREFLSTS